MIKLRAILGVEMSDDQSLDFDSCDQTEDPNPRNLKCDMIELTFLIFLFAIK